MKIDNEKLLIAIANQGMMLKDLSERTGLSTNALRSIRQGKSKPRTATIGKIAKALNVPVEQIIEIGGDGNGTV